MSTKAIPRAAEKTTQSSTLPAISVRGVGKRYDIYSRNIDKLKHLVTLGSRSYGKPFWALRDISFDVQRGEAIGIVGRNGGGKSTLMQIIAGTLAPTEGEVHIHGRVSALLELGSGFNPQFTGRENVYLAGAILGFSRREMDDRFDAIASFADIGDFLEQPVELYSSGMHARLAFSVAALVEPDIFIVDEILSVGDAGFQQKCIARLKRMLDSGLTLLFVSHAADMVKGLCTRGLFLRGGKQVAFGSSGEVVDEYLRSLRESTTERAQSIAAERQPQLAAPIAQAAAADDAQVDAEVLKTQPAGTAHRYGTQHATIRSVRLLDAQGQPRQGYAFNERMIIEVDVRSSIDVDRLDLMCLFRDKAGVDLFGSLTREDGCGLVALKSGQSALFRYELTCTLAPGPHGICLSLVRRPDARGEGQITMDHLDVAASFESIGAPARMIKGKLYLPVKASVVIA